MPFKASMAREAQTCVLTPQPETKKVQTVALKVKRRGQMSAKSGHFRPPKFVIEVNLLITKLLVCCKKV